MQHVHVLCACANVCLHTSLDILSAKLVFVAKILVDFTKSSLPNGIEPNVVLSKLDHTRIHIDTANYVIIMSTSYS